jgi:ribosomal protein L7Ae-like RNA K-turn-binding protein
MIEETVQGDDVVGGVLHKDLVVTLVESNYDKLVIIAQDLEFDNLSDAIAQLVDDRWVQMCECD